MNARVRRAVASDAEAIADIHARGWQAAYRGILPDSFLDQLGQELERRTQFWRSEITSPTMPGHEVWVVEGDAKSGIEVYGFASIGPTRDAGFSAAGEVYAIYLDPNRWGRGLGPPSFHSPLEPTRLPWIFVGHALGSRIECARPQVL